MENLNKTDIGLIGLAVMGENLALNMADKGWRVSVYNRTVPGIEEGVVERFINGRAQGKSIEGYTDIARFVESVAVPRKIMMMVRAGSAVDELMEQLFPLLRSLLLYRNNSISAIFPFLPGLAVLDLNLYKHPGLHSLQFPTIFLRTLLPERIPDLLGSCPVRSS